MTIATATRTVTSADGTPILVEETGSGIPLVLMHGGLPQPGFDTLHTQREEHHEQRHEDGQPGSHGRGNPLAHRSRFVARGARGGDPDMHS